MRDTEKIGFAAKIEFLSRASSYPDAPSLVESIETHFAHVFLSRRFAYKIKKPIKYRQIDFHTLEGRRRSCEQEVVLNRRLAAPTYIAVVPLASAGGILALEGAGEPVDRLVKMRRLTAHRVLDRAAVDGSVTDRDLRPLVEKLVRFYRSTPAVPWTPRDYREHLTHRTRSDAADLLCSGARLDANRIVRIRDAQLDFLRTRADLVEPRASTGRIVDAHGDLRPEHIFLDGDFPNGLDGDVKNGDPQIILGVAA